MKGARPSSARRVGELLTAAVPALSDRLIEVAIRKEWRRILPPALSARSEPGDLRGGILDVRVDNSPWLQELTMRSSEVLAALARRHGVKVTGLRFVLGRVRAEEAVGDARAPREDPADAPRLSAAEARDVETMAAALPDPELSRVLRRLLVKDRLSRRHDATAITLDRSTRRSDGSTAEMERESR
jgi:hypothetical protein